MKISLLDDLGAPAAVALVNIVTKAKAPDWNDKAHYIMTAVGYGAALLGFGGGFLKNIGVASLSGTADHIYTWAKGGVASKVSGSRLAYVPTGPVRQPVQRSYQPEFTTVAPHAF
jgi:hypothetical protein